MLKLMIASPLCSFVNLDFCFDICNTGLMLGGCFAYKLASRTLYSSL